MWKLSIDIWHMAHKIKFVSWFSFGMAKYFTQFNICWPDLLSCYQRQGMCKHYVYWCQKLMIFSKSQFFTFFILNTFYSTRECAISEHKSCNPCVCLMDQIKWTFNFNRFQESHFLSKLTQSDNILYLIVIKKKYVT